MVVSDGMARAHDLDEAAVQQAKQRAQDLLENRDSAKDIAIAQAELAKGDAMIEEVISATGAESIRDMGKVMGAIKAQAAGRADMGAVGARVKAKLGQ